MASRDRGMGAQSIEELIADTNALLTRIDTFLRTIGVAVPLAVDITDRPARQLGIISGAVTTDALKASDLNIEAITKDLRVDVLSIPAITGTVDVSDRVGRLLGIISGAVTTDALKASDLNIDGAKDLQVDVLSLPAITGAVDVTDRVGRLLGVISGTVDVSDRAGRLLGVISGAVTTDALKASDLNIDGTKDLQVDVLSMPAITGSVTTDGLKASDLHIATTNKDLITTDFKSEIARGNETGKTSWVKIGFNPALVANTEADLWSATGVYSFPTGATAMDVISSSASDDGTPTIHTGTSTGGSTTTLVDVAANFLGGTAVVIGDCVVLDKSMNGGRTPEWGYVTGVAAQTLTLSGGFSSGGTGSGRVYEVISKALSTGAQAVKIEYLDTTYAEKSEIVMLNGIAAVNLVNVDTFRINSFRVIAVGTGLKAAGNISLRTAGGGTVYSYISLGYTRARNAQYTVPTGKTLYVDGFTAGYGQADVTAKPHYCRIYTRANREPSTGFLTGSLFYPYSEIVCANTSNFVELKIPTKLPAKTDIRVSAIADFAGIATIALRGWLE